jgi:hypothetical protein
MGAAASSAGAHESDAPAAISTNAPHRRADFPQRMANDIAEYSQVPLTI